MRINRTTRVRESALKVYYHLRAIHKIESNNNDSYIFEDIIHEGYDQINNLLSEGKSILIGTTREKRHPIGGKLSEETNEKILNLSKVHSWQIQECIEILIYFSALNRFNEVEKDFFITKPGWKVAIL